MVKNVCCDGLQPGGSRALSNDRRVQRAGTPSESVTHCLPLASGSVIASEQVERLWLQIACECRVHMHGWLCR